MSFSLLSQVPITRWHIHADMVIFCDDDYDDWLLVKDAWSAVAPTVDLRHTNNGQVLLDLLTTMTTDDDTFPALVLHDLNMPVLNGWETLAAIEANDDLRRIPVVIFTTSSLHGQRCAALASGAAGCITKPSNYNELLDITQSLNTYWFTTHPVQSP
jgi:CheY-like chemotaxis protein